MRYTYGFSPDVNEELLDALTYYFVWKPNKRLADFVALMDAAFATALVHPEALAVFEGMPADHVLRRVTVWHFAFLWRIDREERQLVVERIIHERAEELQA